MLTVAKNRADREKSERDVMVARQPIYNDRMGVYGYELLFRTTQDSTQGMKPTQATAQVLAATLLEFGLEDLVLNRKAVVNVTRAFLDVMQDIQLPTAQLVLDLPDTIAVDDGLADRLVSLRAKGYGISIGGLSNLNQTQRILPLADIFRVDVQRFNTEQLDRIVHFLRQYENLSLQAMKIESMEEYHFYRERGFDFFQGYFLSRPKTYVCRELPANKLAVLQLLATLYNDETTTAALEEQVTRDVTLSYKLLKLINAPFFGIAREVDSIKQAIVLLGRDEIRKLVALLALGGMSQEPAALIETAMLRAKYCELLAGKARLAQESYFTVGMFSALDIVLQQPLETILGKLPLSDSVKDAVLRHEGPMGKALECAQAMENAQWSAMRFQHLDAGTLRDTYKEAIRWTENLVRTL